jgi:hypothetical protein
MRRLALERIVLDGRAIGECKARLLDGFPHMCPDTIQEKAGKMAGKTFQHGGMNASFF